MNEVFRPHSASRTTMAAEGMARRRWSMAEIENMVHAGILAEDERFELIGGEVVPMSPKGARHEWVKRKLNRFFQINAPAHLEVAPETTLHLDDHAFLEPDFCVFRADLDPLLVTSSEVMLAIEVADSSLVYDLGRKIGVYAAYGVREVWVINANTLMTRVHRQLGAEGYSRIENVAFGQRVTPSLAPELAVNLGEIGLTPVG